MSGETLEAMALRLFPKWSPEQRARWCQAKRIAQHMPKHHAKLLPMFDHRRDQQFAPRTLHEAGFL
jgi:hypothetical protein